MLELTNKSVDETNHQGDTVPPTNVDPAMSFWVLGVYVSWGGDTGSSYPKKAR